MHGRSGTGGLIQAGTSTGRKCDGYTRQGVFGDLGVVRFGTTLGSDAQEARSLQFLYETTLTQLQAYFPDELWSRFLPTVAYSHSGVRHALIALSGYHERYLYQSHRLDAFAADQYSMAVKELTGAESSWQIQLASCLIFICIEVNYPLPAFPN